MNQRVRITTGARLHLGLLDVASPFGGCGVMTDRPETIVEARPSGEFELIASDALLQTHSSRAFSIAERLGIHNALPAVRLELVQAAPAHSGLGSGTQLSLAIAEAILQVRSRENESGFRDRLLMAADRGKRSAVGTHGYFFGGFIAEGLSRNVIDALNPIEHRLELPPQWHAVVLLSNPSSQSPRTTTVAGSDEQAKFDQLVASDSERKSLVDRLVDDLVPAIQSGAFERFADSVQRYNRASGMLFAPVQGGPYNGTETTELIDHLISSGHRGVGQSSWGPGIFTWFENEASAMEFCQSWNHPRHNRRRNAFICRPRPSGRRLERLEDQSLG